MEKYLLDSYTMSGREALQSIFLSEYGLRHWTQAQKGSQYKLGHKLLAIVELCPLVGLVATVVEAVIVRFMRQRHHAPVPDSLPSSTDLQTQKVQILFQGNQSFCHGGVDATIAKDVLSKLNENTVEGISFQPEKLDTSVSGGTCTAMSLAFLESYFQTNTNSGSLIERLRKIGTQFKTSSPDMRSRQAAYNTIYVAPGTLNPLQKKVQALAHHLGFKMMYASSELDFSKDTVQSVISKLPEGAFFIRMIKPLNNDKLEEHGHSLVYIKAQQNHFFYDPNYGLKQLSNNNYVEDLYSALDLPSQAFQVNKFGVYQLVPHTIRDTA